LSIIGLELAANKEEEALSSFIYALKSEGTKEQYLFRLKIFFSSLQIPGKTVEEQAAAFLDKVRKNPPEFAENCLISFITDNKHKIEENKLSATSLTNYVIAVRLFYETNNIQFNWKRISRGLPKARTIANDRAPTLQEIQKIIEYSDRRIKSIVYVMCSSGIRVGAWEWLKWKHVIPMPNADGIAKLVVYAGEPQEYFSFISPEAYNELKAYMDFRASYGEKITGESWLMRDLFRTSSVTRNQRYGLAKYPRKIHEDAITKLLSRAIDEENVRGTLKEGQRRYEWKTSHGLRKFFCTRAEQVMKPLNVQILMGHDIGLIGSYLKPTEQELLEDYKKAAVKLLTINADNYSEDLQNQVTELTQKSEEQNYIIKGKLAEKEKELEEIKTKVDWMYHVIESSQGVIDFQEYYTKLLTHNNRMREVEKEIETEQQEEEKLEQEAAEWMDNEIDPPLLSIPKEDEEIS
jgi:integrase